MVPYHLKTDTQIFGNEKMHCYDWISHTVTSLPENQIIPFFFKLSSGGNIKASYRCDLFIITFWYVNLNKNDNSFTENEKKNTSAFFTISSQLKKNYT